MPEQTTPTSPPARDFPGEIDQLLRALNANPENGSALERVVAVAEQWLQADELDMPPDDEVVKRARLASWLTELAAHGRVVHFGWRSGEIGAALVSRRTEVVSYLDHPARAMVASIRNPAERIRYKVLHEAETEIPVEAELVVVETAGFEPAVPLELAHRFLRPGGWLAVIGVPVIHDLRGLLDVGSYHLDGDGEVRITKMSTSDPQIALHRHAYGSMSKSGPARVPAPVVRAPGDTEGTPTVAVEDPLASATTETAHIEFTSRCTLRCVYCPVSQPTYQGFDMDLGLLDGIIATLDRRGVRTVVVNGHGETSMVKGWEGYCRKLIDHGMQLSIISNFGRPFSEEEADVLSRFHAIEVSVDTADAALLKKLRRKVDLSTILHNILRVRAAALRNDVAGPSFSWSSVVNDRSVWGLRDLVRLGLSLEIRHFTFCNLTKYPDVDDALNVQHVSELPVEHVARAREELREALALAKSHGAETFVQQGLLDTLEQKIEDGRTSNRERRGDSGRSLRYTKEQEAGMTRDCLDPWSFAFFSVEKERTVLKPCCWHPAVGVVENGRDPSELFDGDPLRRLRQQLLSGEDLNAHCTSCPARSWIEVKSLETKLLAHLGAAT